MNMQNKLYTIQFSHCRWRISHRVPEQQLRNPCVSWRSQNLWISRNSWISHNLPNSWKKDQNPRKVQSPRQVRIQTPGNEGKKRIPALSLANPIHTPSMMSRVWNISTGQLGSAWLCSLPAPARLLMSWIRETRKSPRFHSNNWKHQCYQHSSCTKSETQQLLGGKLTLPQPKPGQPITPVWKPPCLSVQTKTSGWEETDIKLCNLFLQWTWKVFMLFWKEEGLFLFSWLSIKKKKIIS